MKKVNLSVNKLTFFPREEIVCTIQLNYRKEVKVKAVEVSLIGRFRAWVEDDEGGTINSYKPIMGLREVIWKSVDGKWERLPGNSQFIAKFIVPDDAIPTFPPDELKGRKFHGLVQNFIQLDFRKSKFNVRKTVDLNIKNNFFKSISKDFWKEGNVHPKSSKPAVHMVLEKAQYKPGEVIRGQFVLYNQESRANIRRVLVILRNHVSSKVKRSRPRNEEIFNAPIEFGVVEGQYIPFELLIPHQAYPSVKGDIVNISWTVQIRVDIKRARDVHLTLPILVGSIDSVFDSDAYTLTPISDISFCHYCGAKVTSDMKHCRECGSKLED